MDALTIVIVAVIILLGLIIGGAVAFSRFNTKSTPALKPQPGNDYSPGAGDDGPGLVDPAQKTVETMGVRETRADPTTTIEEIAPAQWEVEVPEPAAGRLGRLRSRLARSHNVFGKGLLGLLTSGSLDQQSWDDIEATLLGADLGVAASAELIAGLKVRLAQANDLSEDFIRLALREELVTLLSEEIGMEYLREIVEQKIDSVENE